MFLIFLMQAILNVSFPAAKKALMFGSNIDLTFARAFTTAVILFLICFIKRINIRKINSTMAITIFIYSIALTIAFYAGNWGLMYASSTRGTIIYSLAPLITALMSFLFLHEKFSLKQWLGLLIGIASIAILVLTSPSKTPEDIGKFVPGFILLCGVISYSSSWIIIKPIIVRDKIPPILINAIAAMFISAVSFINLIASGSGVPATKELWFWSSIQAIAVSVVGYNLYMYLLNRYSPTLIALTSLSGPLFVALYRWILFSTAPPMAFWIATIVIAFSFFVFYSEELQQKRTPN